METKYLNLVLSVQPSIVCVCRLGVGMGGDLRYTQCAEDETWINCIHETP